MRHTVIQEQSNDHSPPSSFAPCINVRSNLAKNQTFSWFQMIKGPAVQLYSKKMSNREVAQVCSEQMDSAKVQHTALNSHKVLVNLVN